MNIKINLNPSLFWLIGLSILCITLLYPPFVFFHLANEVFRIILFACLLILLFVYQLKCTFQKIRISRIIILWTCLMTYLIASVYTNGYEGIRTSLGYALILAFAIILFGIIQSEKSKNFLISAFNIYVKFFFVVPVFSILNFLINLITPSFNFLSPYFSDFIYNYQVSPFGLAIPKSMLGLNISRNFFFFIEPVYLALFYLINVLVVSKYVPKYSKAFNILNIIGGLLTASYFFFVGYILVKFLKLPLVYKIIAGFFAVIIGFVFVNSINDFFSTSSFSDRTLRIGIGLEILQNFKMNHLFFGVGYLFDLGATKGISSGLLTSFIEGGVIGLIIPLVMALILCQGNKILIAIVFLSLLLFEPYKLPFFWYVIVVVGSLHELESHKYIRELF